MSRVERSRAGSGARAGTALRWDRELSAHGHFPFGETKPSERHTRAMALLTAKIAGETEIPVLLDMMEPFNQLEQIPWNATLTERALRTLLGDRNLGLVALLEAPSGLVGYFVVTWGYDLEWNGRDAFLTELFVVSHARGKKLGSAALGLAEQLAREHGARAFHLMVRSENTIARGLYASHGYVSPDRIFMSKEL